MPTVQRRRAWPRRACLTLLALALVLVVLTAPDRLDEMTPSAFLRLPVELLVLLAVVLALPDRARRVRRPRRGGGGPAARRCSRSSRLLDLGFDQALNRPFDPMIDWRYAGDLVETVRGSAAGRARASLLLVAGARRCSRTPGRAARLRRRLPVAPSGTDRPRCARSRCSCRCGWCSACSASAPAPSRSPPTPRRRTPTGRSPGSRPSCATSASSPARRPTDPPATPPAADLLTGLRGKDVLVVFVESYGRVALDDPASPPASRRARRRRPRRLGARRLPRAQRLAHLPHLRRDQLARALDAPVRALGRQPAALRPPRHHRPRDPVQPVRPGRLADGRLGPGQRPRLAAGCVLRLRPRLRLAQRRLPRAALRLPDDARPVHPRGVPAGRARAARPAAGDGRDRPDQQPRAVVADPRPAAAGLRRRRVRLRRDARDAALRGRHLARRGRGCARRTPTRSTTRCSRVVSFLDDVRRRRPGGGAARGPPAGDHRVRAGRPRPRRAGHGHREGPGGRRAGSPPWGWDPGLRPSDDAPVWRMDAFRDEFLRAYGPEGHTGTARAVTR